jgi:hypothetical protein
MFCLWKVFLEIFIEWNWGLLLKGRVLVFNQLNKLKFHLFFVKRFKLKKKMRNWQ